MKCLVPIAAVILAACNNTPHATVTDRSDVCRWSPDGFDRAAVPLSGGARRVTVTLPGPRGPIDGILLRGAQTLTRSVRVPPAATLEIEWVSWTVGKFGKPMEYRVRVETDEGTDTLAEGRARVVATNPVLSIDLTQYAGRVVAFHFDLETPAPQNRFMWSRLSVVSEASGAAPGPPPIGLLEQGFTVIELGSSVLVHEPADERTRLFDVRAARVGGASQPTDLVHSRPVTFRHLERLRMGLAGEQCLDELAPAPITAEARAVLKAIGLLEGAVTAP